MNKITSIVTAAIVVCSLSACTNRNTAMNDRKRYINQGTTQGTRTGYGINNQGTTQGVYKDGVYTGEGNRGPRGIQTAHVVVSGGRITDITLSTVDNVNPNSPNNATGNIITGRTTGNNTVNNIGNRTTGTPGATIGGVTGRTTGDLTGGTNAGTTTRNTGNADYERTRRDLAARMLNSQSYDVSTAGYDSILAENWKLAVRRALEKARR